MSQTCSAPRCNEEATGILYVRYSWAEKFRAHNGNGAYCERHMTYFKPAMEGESYVLPLMPILATK